MLYLFLRERKFRWSKSIWNNASRQAEKGKKKIEEINKYIKKIKSGTLYEDNIKSTEIEQIDRDNIEKFTVNIKLDFKEDQRAKFKETIYTIQLRQYDNIIQPESSRENSKREETIKLVKKLIKGNYQNFQIDYFGSFRQGL